MTASAGGTQSMFSISKHKLPEKSLLATYRDQGAYTDCYVTDVDRVFTHAEFVIAFYTTPLFRLERAILKWAVSRPSTDEDVRLLAEGKAETFAAWRVEAREESQLLLCDYRGRTRSWLMSENPGNGQIPATRLYFGSAVIPARHNDAGEPKMERRMSILLAFHKAYARALLSSARFRLVR